MDGCQGEAAFLVEAQRVQIIIGGDEPEPPTCRPDGNAFDRLYQGCANAQARLGAINRDDLAFVPLKHISGQSHSSFTLLCLTLLDCHKTWQIGWCVAHSMRYDGCCSPMRDDKIGYPIAIAVDKRADLDG